MRVYARTGPNSGVSFGLLGTLFFAPFVAVYLVGCVLVGFVRAVAWAFRRP